MHNLSTFENLYSSSAINEPRYLELSTSYIVVLPTELIYNFEQQRFRSQSRVAAFSTGVCCV